MHEKKILDVLRHRVKRLKHLSKSCVFYDVRQKNPLKFNILKNRAIIKLNLLKAKTEKQKI